MTFASDTVPVEILRDGTYRLTADVVYNGRDDTFTVPCGFVTDLASIPNYCTWLVPVAGVGDRAAIVHDWLCTELAEIHAKGDGWRKWRGWPPSIARDTDGIFRRILGELGVPFCRRWLMWAGVRIGALINPARRAGWLRDAWRVALITVLAAPIVLPISLLALIGAAIDNAVERVA